MQTVKPLRRKPRPHRSLEMQRPTNAPAIRLALLPGGILPKRQSEDAVGYDVHVRAIVSPSEMDPQNPNLRRTVFDFEREPSADAPFASQVVSDPKQPDRLIYVMRPGEDVLVGIGFATYMPPPMFYWVAPRSGLASKWGVTVTNAPGTVDPDYRGEAGVLVLNRSTKPFELQWGMRIAQILFQFALHPPIHQVAVEDLPPSFRGAGGFGSTGLR